MTLNLKHLVSGVVKIGIAMLSVVMLSYKNIKYSKYVADYLTVVNSKSIKVHLHLQILHEITH